jgi:hypothetical protein
MFVSGELSHYCKLISQGRDTFLARQLFAQRSLEIAFRIWSTTLGFEVALNIVDRAFDVCEGKLSAAMLDLARQLNLPLL